MKLVTIEKKKTHWRFKEKFFFCHIPVEWYLCPKLSLNFSRLSWNNLSSYLKGEWLFFFFSTEKKKKTTWNRLVTVYCERECSIHEVRECPVCLGFGTNVCENVLGPLSHSVLLWYFCQVSVLSTKQKC